VAEVTSIVRDRGRALGVVIAVVMSAALVSAPMAFGAGDPVASGTFKLKLSGGFKKQLKRNHVRMKPMKFFKIKPNGSNLDPTTGAGVLKLGKVTFKKGGKKLVFKNAKATLGANGGKGSVSGTAKGNNAKIFRLKGGTLARNGFGATLTGIKAKFLKGAAKKINKALELNSLHPGKVGKASASEQPKTVAVTGGTAFVDIPTGYLPASGFVPGSGQDPNTVAAKQPSHCISPVNGVEAIAPAEVGSTLHPNANVPLPTGVSARFKFPVTGGTVGPTGTAGAIELGGGVRLQTGVGILPSPPFPPGTPDTFVFPQASNCAGETPGESTSNSVLNTTNLGPNLGLGNVQSHVVFGGLQPGCNQTGQPPTCPTAVFSGDKGIAIGQLINLSGVTVAADPTAKTVSINGGLITNNALTAVTLSGLFPNATDPADSTKDWADGDKFGVSTLNVTTR
jgi:hypothetical protein